MPIYKCKVRGEEKVRLVKAGSAAQARDHIVEAESINAEEMADLIEGGAKLEKAGEGDQAPAGDDAGTNRDGDK